MPWFNDSGSSSFKGPGRKAKAVLSKELADQIALEFVPMRFDLGTPETAMEYLEQKKQGSDFRMSEVIRIQTGISELEEDKDEEKIDIAALEKLKEVQEQAYQQAFSLGLEEGRREAFQKVSREISSKVEEIDKLIFSIKNLKKDLTAFNETHLIKLTFQIASRLAKTEVQGNQDAVLNVLRDAISLAQDEEQMNVHVAPGQFEFLEQLKNEVGREYEFLKNIKFQSNKDISEGGCVIETNYGEVDARIEQRIDQLWITLSESLHKVKDRIAS